MTARFICIRDDDASVHTPAELLRQIRSNVWRGRPVTYGWVPYASPSSFQRELPARDPETAESNRLLTDVLAEWVEEGSAEVALHGLTHEDRYDFGQAVPEFAVSDPALAERAIAELRSMKRTFGTRFFIPPHNRLDRKIGTALLDAGFNVCRSLDEHDIEALLSRIGRAISREQAKRLLPFCRQGGAVEIFQTVLLSKRRIARHEIPSVVLADAISAALDSAGLAVMTVHWWDFANPGGELDLSFARYVRELLDRVEASHRFAYCTLSAGAGQLAAR